MKTLPKARAKSAAGKRRASGGLAKLTPPPGKLARDVMTDYPAPSPNFDADFVSKIVAARAER
jgi:hypothetical protein